MPYLAAQKLCGSPCTPCLCGKKLISTNHGGIDNTDIPAWPAGMAQRKNQKTFLFRQPHIRSSKCK